MIRLPARWLRQTCTLTPVTQGGDGTVTGDPLTVPCRTEDSTVFTVNGSGVGVRVRATVTYMRPGPDVQVDSLLSVDGGPVLTVRQVQTDTDVRARPVLLTVTAS